MTGLVWRIRTHCYPASSPALKGTGSVNADEFEDQMAHSFGIETVRTLLRTHLDLLAIATLMRVARRGTRIT